MAPLAFALATAFCTQDPSVSHADVIDRYIAAYNARDLAAMSSVFMEDARIQAWEFDGERGDHTVAVLLQGLPNVFAENPDVQMSYHGRIEMGSGLAQIESYSGSLDDALVVYTIVSGCVVARDSYWEPAH